ncbi:hypothetical protein [Roseofilum sp. Guam]|uniref:hypothetical protein n=1 Tax=Roseofilum sp. Guam TaxID=2821502 RepID=UPI001B2DBE5E|nr:hypothetical protein [Roseofilum sp. Guam]MBP0030953.1 hypothetical protein [Roseofilum sp. Guam]
MADEIEQKQNNDERLVPVFNSLNIRKLAKTNLKHLQDLPQFPGIYFAVDSGYRVHYIGVSTTNLSERLENHDRLADFKRSNVQYIAYMTGFDNEDLGNMETQAISYFNPPLNSNKIDLTPIVDLGINGLDLLECYAELKRQQKAIELELEGYKPNVLSIIQAAGGKIQGTGYTASTPVKPKWLYSQELEDLANEVKVRQKEERDNNIATYEEVTMFPVIRISQ